MINDKLNLLRSEESATRTSTDSGKTRTQESKAKMDRLWLEDPDKFNPLRDCLGRERIKRTLDAVSQYSPPIISTAADMGCGFGVLARALRDQGAQVDALDISRKALDIVERSGDKNIHLFCENLPATTLPDDNYDLVISTEVIAYLSSRDYRLYMAELARIVKPEGYIVCSTPLDFRTYDPLKHFAKLAETEFEIARWILSHHALYVRLKNFLEFPSKLIRAKNDPGYKERQLKKRKGISYYWFKYNSRFPAALIWQFLKIALHPLVHFVSQSRGFLLLLERICQFFSSDSGVSHAIFIGKRRPLSFPLDMKERPREHKHKKQLWE